METPELPKGYFFEVVEGVNYLHDPWRNVAPKVHIKKRIYFLWSEIVFTAKLTNMSGTHPTPEHVYSGMVTAKEGWENLIEKSKVYGQYPPNKLKDLLNGK